MVKGNWRRPAIVVAALFGLIIGGAAFGRPAASHSARRWTIDDILTVPTVTGLALAQDGRSAAFATKAVDPASNTVSATLWLADIAHRRVRSLLRASSIDDVRAIPGSAAWNVRADLGIGVQLYRVDASGRVTPDVVSEPTVRVGNADHAIPSAAMERPRQVGILSYSWAPNGAWLWYAAVKPVEKPREIVFDQQLDGQLNTRRPPIEAQVEYHLRSRDGADRLIATRLTSDRLAFYFGGNISWASTELRYAEENVSPNGPPSYGQIAVDLRTARTRKLPQPPDNPFGVPLAGPWGGRLAVGGFGATRVLTERFSDGAQRSYGAAAFLLGDPRSAGNWVANDGRSAIIGTRMIDHPRYNLLWLDRHGHRSIGGNDSLTKCDFTADLSKGVCVRESLVRPPELVLVQPRSGTIRRLSAISPRHEAITPLRITAREWTNTLGYTAYGFVIWPRNYKRGQRYPAIVITHGSDADERFVRADFQWNYPAQIFAERGYVVLLVNDPAPSQDAKLSAAYDQWGSGSGTIPPKDLQRLLWLNGVYCFESAIDEMAAAGVVDPSRVGIAGYSRGSQMVDVTMTQSTRFRAGSAGDGSYLEPYAYSWQMRSYNVVFGGSPYGSAIGAYHALSPSLRASNVRGAVLQQLAAPLGGAADFFRALRAAGVPAQISYYPGDDATSDETHIFHIPLNRMTAMRENIAWFDFWLRGERSEIMPFPERYAEWAAMAKSAAPLMGGR